MGEIFLSECHPETGTLDRGIVLDEGFQFFVIEQIAFTRADARVGERSVYLQRSGGHPFAVLPVASVLSDFPDVDFGVEVGGKSFSVVSGIAVDDVEIFHL